MNDRRTKRSSDPTEALQYLIEAVADRSEVQALALLDADGRIIAGMGTARNLAGLQRITGPVSRGEPCDQFDEVTAGTDFMATAIRLRERTVYLSALGTKIRQLRDALGAVARIVGVQREAMRTGPAHPALA
jgi:hypothetical protein